MKRKTRKSPRWKFEFRTIDPVDGSFNPPVIAHAIVRQATEKVKLLVTAADVRRSIELKGWGNTQCCSMAICAKRNKHKFSHDVRSYVDWTFTRAYVSSKLGKDGLPCECFIYEHSDEIAYLNDDEDGQRQLLVELERDGPREIELRPVSPHKQVPIEEDRKRRKQLALGLHPRRPRSQFKGAKARFAYVLLGGNEPI